MADVGKVYPTEIHLLKKAIEVQGDLLNQERLERRSEDDRIRLELGALKRLCEQIHPGFLKRFEKLYDQETLNRNPELEPRTRPAVVVPIRKARSPKVNRRRPIRF